MTKKELIKALSPYADDMEVYIKERACENVRPVDSVVCGWYVDDEMDAPSFVPESEDPEAYDIGPEEV
jgi:hypothetical protein